MGSPAKDAVNYGDDKAVEKVIQEKGLNAPRLSPTVIEGAIASEQYHVPAGTTLTICILTLRNGFQVTGESAAASPENFDVEIGKGIARKNAMQKIWPLEGYLLKQRLYERRDRVVDADDTQAAQGFPPRG